MKIRIFLLQVLFLGFCSLQAQEFSFQLYFSDSNSEKDTLTLGYDEAGTFALDIEFEEENIFDSESRSDFDVRIGLMPEFGDYANLKEHFKKQIVRKDCAKNFPEVLVIMIRSENWPVTATWDASLFTDSCNEGSLLASNQPAAWWDVGSPSDLWRVLMDESNEVTFTENVDYDQNNKINENYAFIDSSGGEVSLFWFAFGKRNLGASTEEEAGESRLTIVPNPVEDVFVIEGINSNEISSVEVIDLLGHKIKSLEPENLHIGDLPSASYMLSIKMKNASRRHTKILKY